MGYDLANENGKGFRWNMWYWGSVYSLALAYDWQPQGTKINKDRFENYEDYEDYKENYEGSYFGNDGQRVCAEDAKAFSDALEASLDDIPDEDVRDLPSDGYRKIDDSFMAERAKVWGGEKATLVVQFSGSNKDYLKEFIEFLRGGAFYIY